MRALFPEVYAEFTPISRFDTRPFTDVADTVAPFARASAHDTCGTSVVPARNGHAVNPNASRAAKRRKRRCNVNSILTRREKLVAEVAQLRARNKASRFLENAQQLLTRWWSTASWDEREELLKSVEWLIRLEKAAGAGLDSRPEWQAAHPAEVTPW